MFRRKSYLMLVMLLMVLFMLSACGGNFVKTSYSTIYTAGQAYDAGMKSVSALQAQGKITTEQRTEINKVGNVFYVSYQTAAAALDAYSRSMSLTTQNSVTTAINTMLAGWTTFKGNVNRILPNTITTEVK